MEHETTGKRHGIVRMVTGDGDILEMSYRNGNRHGLKRVVYKNVVKVFLNKDGSSVAYVCFDSDFYETERGGPQQHLLDDFTADMFRVDDARILK